MSFNKKIITSFLVAMSAVSLGAMQLSNSSQEFKKPQSQPIDIKRSPDNTSNYSIPSLTSMWTSAKNTVTNYLSDEAAFKKLGWPPSDETAQDELRDTLAIYTRVNESLQTGVTYDDFKKDYSSINNRQYYCQRVLDALQDHSHSVALALHCLQHHRPAMNFFDLSRFLAFVNCEQEKAKKAGLEFAQLTIPTEGNAFLNDFFKQTVSLKYPQDKERQKEEDERKHKEEEERKRKEEERNKKEEAERIKKEEDEKKKKEEEVRLAELARQEKEAQLQKEREEQLAKEKEEQERLAQEKAQQEESPKEENKQEGQKSKKHGKK